MEDMIDVTAAPLLDLVKAAYDLSKPQGLGFIHARPGDLSDKDAQDIIDYEKPGSGIAARMDYVHGRACKLTVYKKDGKHFIQKPWFDHSDTQLAQLLSNVGITYKGEKDA